MYYNKKLAKIVGLALIILLSINSTFTVRSETKKEVKSSLKSVEKIDNYIKVTENENLALYLNETNLSIKVLNKKSNFLWSSTIDSMDPDLNEEWQALASSPIVVEYMDSTNSINRLFMDNFNVNLETQKKPNGFISTIQYINEGISFSVEVTLKDDYLDIRIPYSSIKEESNEYKIQNIIIYPFLGAIKGNKKGSYIFIPDGSGALMDLSQNTTATQPFLGRVYGEDLGLKEMYLKSMKFSLTLPSEKIYIPVFGFINEENKNAFIASIQNGAEYAEIDAYRRGIITDYNWVCAKFIYRETYKQLIDKKGNGIIVNQSEKNNFDAHVRYMFLEGDSANYVGMAKRYQKDLVERGILKKKSEEKGVPLRIEFLMAENKKFFFWKRAIYMTKFEDIKNILKELKENGIDNLNVTLRGYTKKGITDSSPTHLPFDSKLGSKDDLQDVLKETNNNLHFYADYSKVYRKSKGYSKADVALTISDQFITTAENNYYLNPEATRKIFEREKNKFNKLGFYNIALDTVGNTLFSSYGGKQITRRDAIKAYEEMLTGENKYSFFKPNEYLWKYAKDIYDIPMGSSNYLIEDMPIPFIQIVLKGYIDYYAPALNFSSDLRLDTLKMIDYGCYPSFYLTKESPSKLLDTASEWLYTSEYRVWKDKIISEYKLINEVLKNVTGAEITGRNELSKGIVKVDYSNGVSIIINYTDLDYNYGSYKITSKNCAVLRGDKN